MSVAIQIEDVSKRYRLGLTHANSLRDLANGLLAGVLNRRGAAAADAGNAGNAGDTQRGRRASSEFWALHDVTFDVKEGDRLGIIGRNGAGKSTLLKVLSRITSPTSGRIEILGRVASLLEVGTGFHPELTGRENVYLNGTILGMTRTEVSRQFEAIVDFAGVETFIDTPVKRYSSGMKVRLGFAVAAHLEPEIMIVDEVLAVGDLEFQRKCLGKMDEVAKSGRTILFVSHNMSAVSQLCNRGVVLHQGRTAGAMPISEAIDLYIRQTPSGDRDGHFIAEPLDDADQITEIRVSQDGRDTSTIKHNAEIDILFRVRSSNRTFPLLLSIAICDRFQRKVFTAATEITAADFGRRGHEIMRSLRIERRFLMPGQYSVIAGLLDAGKRILDHHRHVASFEIENVGDDHLLSGDGDFGVVFGNFEWLRAEVGQNARRVPAEGCVQQ